MVVVDERRCQIRGKKNPAPKERSLADEDRCIFVEKTEEGGGRKNKLTMQLH